MIEQSSAIVVVRGEAREKVVPDYASIYFSNEASPVASTQEEALENAQKIVTHLRSILEKENGLRALYVTHVWAGEHYEWVDGQRFLKGWNAIVSGSIETSVDRVGFFLSRLSKVGLSTNSISWQLDRDNKVYRDTRKEAVANARLAAQDFADAAGMNLGSLRVLADPGLSGASAVSQDPFAAPAGISMRGGVSGGGESHLQLTPKPIEVVAVVEATYNLYAAFKAKDNRI